MLGALAAACNGTVSILSSAGGGVGEAPYAAEIQSVVQTQVQKRKRGR